MADVKNRLYRRKFYSVIRSLFEGWARAINVCSAAYGFSAKYLPATCHRGTRSVFRERGRLHPVIAVCIDDPPARHNRMFAALDVRCVGYFILSRFVDASNFTWNVIFLLLEIGWDNFIARINAATWLIVEISVGSFLLRSCICFYPNKIEINLKSIGLDLIFLDLNNMNFIFYLFLNVFIALLSILHIWKIYNFQILWL